MGKQKESEVEQVEPKEGVVDLHKRVKVEVTDSAPHHKPGDVIECSEFVAAKMEKNGWGRILSILLIGLFAFVGTLNAQTTNYQKMAKVVSALPATATSLIFSDTVTNAGTNYLTTGYPQSGTSYAGNRTAIVNLAYTSVINVTITKISGTVGGTLTLQGSLDDVNYVKVANPTYAGTYTYTPTDVATQSISFALPNNPYKFYRVSWTGTGTMAASMVAQYWSH